MHDRHYGSLTDLTRAEPTAENARVQRGEEFITLRPAESSLLRRGRREYGVDGIEDVLRLTKTGWPEGLRRMREALRTMDVPGVASVRRRRVRRDFGDHLDVQRVYAGELDRAWSATERAVRRGVGRHVETLLVQVGASWSRDADELFWRGAAAVMLADALEGSGRRVRIVAFDGTRGLSQQIPHDTIQTVSVEIKAADQPLDLERAAFALALTGTFRVWFFRAMCAVPVKVKGDFGHPVHLSAGRVSDPSRLPEGLRALIGTDATIIVDGIEGRREAQAFLNSTLGGFAESRVRRAV